MTALEAGLGDQVQRLEHVISQVRACCASMQVQSRALDDTAAAHTGSADNCDLHGQAVDAAAHREDARLATARADQLREARIQLSQALVAHVPAPRSAS